MRTNFNFSALNSSGRRRFSLQKKSPNWKVVVSVSAALAMALGIAGCAIVSNNDKNVDPTTPTAQEQTQDEAEQSVEDEYALLIDRLNISGLEMVDNLTPKVEAEVQKQLEALVPEGGTIIDASDVYVAPDGSTWVSEEDYLKYIEGQENTNTTGEEETGKGEVVQDGYLAPDGTVWISEAEYLKYIEGQNSNETGTGTATEDVQVEGDYYLAPDGSVWESEADYLKYVQSEKGSSETTVENGDVVEVEDSSVYKAPDGTYWESEEDYLNSLKADTVVDETVKEEQKEEVKEETGKGEETTDNYYVAPDGTRWESKAMYDEYIKGQEEAAVAETTSVEETTTVTETVVEETTVTNTSTDYYLAPDGELWVSEAAYLEHIGATSSTETGMGEEEAVIETSEGVEVVPESEYQENTDVEQAVDTSNYYIDEYGNCWASYEDYLAYTQYMAQEENGKQR